MPEHRVCTWQRALCVTLWQASQQQPSLGVTIPPAACRVGCAGAAGRGAQQRSFADGWGCRADAQRAAGSGVALCLHLGRLSDHRLLSPTLCDICCLAVLSARLLRCLLARRLGYKSPVHCRLEVTWRRQRQLGRSGQGHRLCMAARRKLLPRQTSPVKGRRAQGASMTRGPPLDSRVTQLHRLVQTLSTVLNH